MGEPLLLDEATLNLLADKIAERLKPPPTLVTKEELGRALRVSPATVDRLSREGMPRGYIGDMPRFDLAKCQAWALEHGRKLSERAAPAPDKEDLGPVRWITPRAR